MTRSFFLALALAPLAVAGCTPTQWVHPDKGVANLEQDQAECSRMARNQSQQYASASSPWPTSAQPYREGGGVAQSNDTMASASRRDPFLDEARLANDCMQAQGYRLMPVTK